MPFVPDSRFVPDTPPETPAAPPESTPTPVNAGMANFSASVLGLPVDTAQNIYNLGKAGMGVATGHPELFPTIEGTPGGSESIKRVLRMASEMSGIKGLSPDNPQPENKVGTAAYDLTSRGGFIPGGALPALGSMVGEKLGGTPGAIAGSMVPGVGISAYNAARAPSLAQAQAMNSVRDKTLNKAMDIGMGVPPSSVNPTLLGNAVETFGGKAPLKQSFELKNQQATNAAVRQELKMPKNAEITDASLNGLIDKASEPYRKLAALSPSAAEDIQVLRDTRSEAQDYWKAWNRNARPEDKRQAISLDKKAAALENSLDAQATLTGHPAFVQELRDARTYIAKVYDVKKSINIGDGNVDAQVLGRMMDRGKPLSGNLQTIAKFAQGPGAQYTREGSKVPPPDVSGYGLSPYAAALLGFEGYQHLGSVGAALAGIPFARHGARALMTSGPAQNLLARPNYEPALQAQSQLPMLMQQGILSNQR